jgi:hypothetical protein
MNEGRRDRDRQKRRLRNEGLENVFHKGIPTSNPDFMEEVGLDDARLLDRFHVCGSILLPTVSRQSCFLLFSFYYRY